MTMTDRSRLFEELDPPPGGLERLRARLDAAGTVAPPPRRESRPLGWAAAAVAVVAAVWVGVAAPWGRPAEPGLITADGNPALVRLGLAPTPGFNVHWLSFGLIDAGILGLADRPGAGRGGHAGGALLPGRGAGRG